MQTWNSHPGHDVRAFTLTSTLMYLVHLFTDRTVASWSPVWRYYYRRWGWQGRRPWGWSPHGWDQCPSKGTPRELSPLLSCEDAARRPPAANQEAGPHQTQKLPPPWSGLPRFPSCEKDISAVSAARSMVFLWWQPEWTKTYVPSE